MGSKFHNIISNVDLITNNLAQSTGSLYQPVLFMLFTCILLLISIVILLFVILKTRREYRKHKIARANLTFNGNKSKDNFSPSGIYCNNINKLFA